MVFSKIAAAVVVAVLCLFFGAYGQVKDSDNKGAAVDVTAGGIQVGEVVPEVLVAGVHNYKDASGKASGSFRLSDFRGKLLILDFWATWCVPCVGMIPKMDALQRKYEGKVAFVSATYQSEGEVLPFLGELEKRQGVQSTVPVVAGSKLLHEMFPHLTLPHYVWISGEGKVLAITGAEEVNAGNIEKALKEGVALRKKTDMRLAHDPKLPLLANGNGGDGSNLLRHSVLTRYTEGLVAGYSVGAGRVTCTNMTMLQLFRLAFGGREIDLGWNRTLVKTRDSAELRYAKGRAENYLSWLDAGRGFCYELRVPVGSDGRLFELMREDLMRYFPGYSASLGNRKIKCWVLKRTSPVDRIASKGGTVLNRFGNGAQLVNSSLAVLVSRIGSVYMDGSKYPLVDGTSYTGRVDLVLDTDLRDMERLNDALRAYDLQFVLETAQTPVLEIRDRLSDPKAK